MPTPTVATEATPGLFASLRSLLTVWVALLQTRLELLSTDLEEQRHCFGWIVLLGLASIFCLSFGLLLLTLFVVVCFWDNRLPVLGGFTLLYLAGGIATALIMRNQVRTRPKFLGATLEELSKDYRRLTS